MMPTDMMHMQAQQPQLPEFYNYQMFFIIAALILYALTAFLYSASSSGNTKGVVKQIAHAFLSLGLIANLMVLVIRWIHGERLPLNNIFETLSFFTLISGIILFILDLWYKISDYAIYVMILIIIALCAVAFGPGFEHERTSIPPSMPALNSYWLPIHVIITFIAYAGFAVAACAGVRYLIIKSFHADTTPYEATMNTLDAIMYKLISISYVLLGAGIISGSIWANEAWGGYWMWDPKEVWSLITWVFYTMYLHTRYKTSWGKATYAGLSVVGFICVVFTYICVSYLRVFSGEHSF